MADVSLEGRMQLALNDYKKGCFTSIAKAALAYDISRATLQRRVQGRASRTNTTANCRKLTDTEESTLTTWILDMDRRGLPPQISTVRYLAQLLFSARISSPEALIGEKWVNRFIKRHKELCSKYTRKYDYQRAKCEDPELIKSWFTRVRDTIQKYGVLEQDIYNMDETGFQMGVISTAKVICGSETRDSRAKAIQPGNREWVTAIEAVNATGWVLPPQIILAAKQHQSKWYSMIPKDYQLSVSDNGWTNDKLGFEWLQHFDKHTASRTIGRYRLLILDGHSSHATAEFDKFCTDRHIIPLYMPPHSSHLCQPLDISCFSPLKRFYGQKTQDMIRTGIYSIDKEDFLYLYPGVRRALSAANIQSGFAAAGLIPLSPERVLKKLHIQLKTPTPPSTAHSNQSFSGPGKTPANMHQLEQHKKRIQHLRNRQSVSPSTMEQAVDQAIKCAEIAMQTNTLLYHELSQLRTACQHQKRKREASRYFIATGGSLTGEQGQQLTKEKEQEQEQLMQPRPRRAPRCSNCNQPGHNRLKCPNSK